MSLLQLVTAASSAAILVFCRFVKPKSRKRRCNAGLAPATIVSLPRFCASSIIRSIASVAVMPMRGTLVTSRIRNLQVRIFPMRADIPFAAPKLRGPSSRKYIS